jgi:acetylornithine deacetylase/succinyl-diaminopimelate desuccinylase-like protein
MTRDLPDTPAVTADDLRDRLDGLLERSLSDLESLVRIPSIAFAGYERSTLERSAEAVAALLRDAGLPEVRITRVGEGAPAVIARRPAAIPRPGRPRPSSRDVRGTGCSGGERPMTRPG